MATIAPVRISYVCAIIAIAAVAAVGSVWAGGTSQHGRIAAGALRIDVSSGLRSPEIAHLPVLYVEGLI
jgi:hypothetical protein